MGPPEKALNPPLKFASSLSFSGKAERPPNRSYNFAAAGRLGQTLREATAARRLGKTPREATAARRLGQTPREATAARYEGGPREGPSTKR